MLKYERILHNGKSKKNRLGGSRRAKTVHVGLGEVQRESAMQIDEKLIDYLEDLSCLTLSNAEKERLAGDLKKILSGMARLGELNTEDVPERSHPFDNVNSFRDDEVRLSFDRELILRNAPDKNREMFIAPKTVE